MCIRMLRLKATDLAPQFPEDGKLAFPAQDSRSDRMAKQNASGKHIWLTDSAGTQPPKPQATEGDFKKWGGSTDLQQAQYLVRAFLVLSELDLDRAYIYWFNDEDVASVHASSGLTRHYSRSLLSTRWRPSRATLGGYRFARVVTKKPGELYVSNSGTERSPLVDLGRMVANRRGPQGYHAPGSSFGGRTKRAEQWPVRPWRPNRCDGRASRRRDRVGDQRIACLSLATICSLPKMKAGTSRGRGAAACR